MERNDYLDPYLEVKEVDPDRMYEEWRDRKMSDEMDAARKEVFDALDNMERVLCPNSERLKHESAIWREFACAAMSENKTVSLDEFLEKTKAQGQSGNTYTNLSRGALGPSLLFSQEQMQRNNESAIWREFACAALNAIGDSWLSYADPAAHVADIADAMLEEARKRGKL